MVISKNRWYFEYDNLYFQYDEFNFYLNSLGIIEIITTEKNKTYDIPECFKSNGYYDITDDENYTNYSISMSNSIIRKFGNIEEADIKRVIKMRKKISGLLK